MTEDLERMLKGEYNDWKLGIIAHNGYGFVFKDPHIEDNKYVFLKSSSKITAFDIRGEICLPSRLFGSRSLNDMVSEEDLRAPVYGGIVKTLLPTLKLGGYEVLFDCWIFMKTPLNEKFPATFYYGPSGLAIGGWKMKDYDDSTLFPQNFRELINFSPFDMNKNALVDLCDNLKKALDGVPVSDYYAQYRHDWGVSLIGIKEGRPFIYEIGKRRTKAYLQKFYNSIKI